MHMMHFLILPLNQLLIVNYNYKMTSTLQKWAEVWRMESNPTRCEHLQITNKHMHNFIYARYTL